MKNTNAWFDERHYNNYLFKHYWQRNDIAVVMDFAEKLYNTLPSYKTLSGDEYHRLMDAKHRLVIQTTIKRFGLEEKIEREVKEK